MSGIDVGMLWESVDPTEALSTRFGFADVGAAVAWLAEGLETSWGLRVDGCSRLIISAKNILAWLDVAGRPVLAKCSGEAGRHRRLVGAARLTEWLSGCGIPVATPIAATDGRLQVLVDDRSLGLQPVVPGELLDADDSDQVELAGQVLARLHSALAAYSEAIDAGPRRPGEQLVQNDFRSANVLHRDGRIAAVLDFEEVAYRNPMSDLGQASVLLATRFHDWRPTRADTRAAFVDAYEVVTPLTVADRHQLQRATERVLAHFGWE